MIRVALVEVAELLQLAELDLFLLPAQAETVRHPQYRDLQQPMLVAVAAVFFLQELLAQEVLVVEVRGVIPLLWGLMELLTQAVAGAAAVN